MCRSIKTLYNFEPPATQEEIRASALQYVRKVSGFRKPSIVNQEAFDAAVAEITQITAVLIENLQTSAPLRKREKLSGER
jgi:hypothetical protein